MKESLWRAVYDRDFLKAKEQILKLSFYEKWIVLNESSVHPYFPMRLPYVDKHLNKTVMPKTLLSEAIMKGDEQITELLLEHGAKLSYGFPSILRQEMPPLFWALWQSNLPLARVLLKYGEMVNEIDKYGKTALQVSAENGMFNFVELLIQYNADPSIRWRSQTARHLAENCHHFRIVESLLDYEQQFPHIDFTRASAISSLPIALRFLRPPGTLVDAIQRDDFEAVNFFLQEGENPEEKCAQLPHSSTALIQAIRFQVSFELADLLIKYGADVHATDARGWTCLHEAAFLNNKKYVMFFLDRGANPKTKMLNSPFFTPYTLAFQEGKNEIASLITRYVKITV